MLKRMKKSLNRKISRLYLELNCLGKNVTDYPLYRQILINMRVLLSVTFVAVFYFQRVISGRPPFDWGPPSPNRGNGNNKNENENNENTNDNNNKDMHINTYQTNENPKCTQLKSFTPNLCSIDSARRLCPIHCRKPEYIRNCKEDLLYIYSLSVTLCLKWLSGYFGRRKFISENSNNSF